LTGEFAYNKNKTAFVISGEKSVEINNMHKKILPSVELTQKGVFAER